jgi:2-polyprenyl-3-methyl-5-hydroxy-6-metoxy-1,4-benzoquinol methylase
MLDPVAAYELISAQFPAIALRRKHYLDAVDALIVTRIPVESRALLDVGAGSGNRARKIAAQTEISKVVLLEPSRGMSGQPEGAEIWQIRAEDLIVASKKPAFDAIICLWNVLGHIRSAPTRVLVLRKLRDLLTASGSLFIDVNHRYNLRAYGIPRTVLRYAKDLIAPGEENGDVLARWSLNGVECSTYGHVFTHREMRGLAAAASLKIVECVSLDYETGKPTRFPFQGNLLYVLKP